MNMCARVCKCQFVCIQMSVDLSLLLKDSPGVFFYLVTEVL